MNVIVSIEGREAIPVRALAWLTGWHFSAAEVAEALAGDLDWPQVVATYRLEGAAVGLYERRLWTNTHLVDLEHLAAKELDADQWRAACTQALPAGIFVWRSEWEQAYNASPDGPDALRKLAECADDLEDVEARTLNLSPFVPPELAALVKHGFDAPTPQAAQVSPVEEPVPPAKRSSLWDAVTPYIVETMRAGQFATAKLLFNALEATVGEGSPFEKGTGDNRGSLYVRDLSAPLALKTLQNKWQELLAEASKK